MGDIKTPRQAKGPRDLKILKKTSQSVYSAKLPPRSAASFKHAHSLVGARQVKRIDRQEWEKRIADIHNLLEEHRHGRANRLYTSIDKANAALQEAMRKEQELVTYAEELNASNEEMRAANEEMRANAEEMRASNEELRSVTEELERVHRDQEQLVTLFGEGKLDSLQKLSSIINTLEDDQGRTTGGTQRDTIAKGQEALDDFTKAVTLLREYWLLDQKTMVQERHDCEEILLDGLGELSDLIEQQKGRVTNSALPELYLDREVLLEVFTILIDNGIRYRGESPPYIHVSAQRVGDWKKEIPEPKIDQGWVFSLLDNGRGIAEEKLQDIFSIFENLGHGQDGMGLARCWKLVRKLGGRIWVESTIGEGTTVHFTIPDFDEG